MLREVVIRDVAFMLRLTESEQKWKPYGEGTPTQSFWDGKILAHKQL